MKIPASAPPVPNAPAAAQPADVAARDEVTVTTHRAPGQIEVEARYDMTLYHRLWRREWAPSQEPRWFLAAFVVVFASAVILMLFAFWRAAF